MSAKLSKKKIYLVRKYMQNKSLLDILQQMTKTLCKIKTPPKSITKCKKMLRTKHIHIYDFVQGNYKMCGSLHKLRQRILEIGPYPLEKVPGRLKPLLRNFQQVATRL